VDERVIRTREEQDRILKFISVKSFTPDLRERIQSHFSAVQSNVSEEQDRLLATLSHGLRVELARLIWREFLSKVYLFRQCSGQFLDAVCVLVQETHFGPEDLIGISGEVSSALVILVYGGVESYTSDSDKVKKTVRKGHCVGPLSFFFGVRQFVSTRAARSGAVCIRLHNEGMSEVLQIFPKDEERVKQNALNFYSKSKSEGSIAGFSTASGGTETTLADDDSDDSDGKSKASGFTEKSDKSKSSKRSRKSDADKDIEGDDAKNEDLVGGADSMDPSNEGFEDEPKENVKIFDEEEELPLMKEVDHVSFSFFCRLVSLCSTYTLAPFGRCP